MGVKGCTLCGAQTLHLCVQRVLEKYDVEYFQCPDCDMIQTESPFWLEEEPWSSISHLDTGAVARDARCVRVATAIAHIFGLDPSSRFLDYGGGYGLFVRSMRDRGFPFRWCDRYSQNVFAKGFEGQPDKPHDMVTCFEMFEHLTEVRDGLDPILGCGHEVVLVGTVLHSGHQAGWWYYCPEIGNHVSFFSAKTMRFAAKKWGYQVVSSSDLTVFFRRPLSPLRHKLLRQVLQEARVLRILQLFAPRYASLASDDCADLLQKHLSNRQGKSGAITPSAESPRKEKLAASTSQVRKRNVALRLAETANVLLTPFQQRSLQ
jgi:hypothetical protein